MSHFILYPVALSVALVSAAFDKSSLPSCQVGEKFDKNGFRCSFRLAGDDSLLQVRDRGELQVGLCEPWCASDTEELEKKCRWQRCKGCSDCSAVATKNRKRSTGKGRSASTGKGRSASTGKGQSASTAAPEPEPEPESLSLPMSCDSIRTSAPHFALLGNATAEDFVEDTFTKYAAEKVDAVQCRVAYAEMRAQVVPYDPTEAIPTSQYNAYVSMNKLGLPQPLEVGDIVVAPYNLGNPWTNSSPPSPDPYLSVSSDLQATDPGTNVPFGLPDADVTCANSSHRVNVSNMRCAYCDIPSTCLPGMGCFGYFKAECHFDPAWVASAKEAAELMVQTLKPAAATSEPVDEPEPEGAPEPESEAEPEPEPESSEVPSTVK